MKKLLSFSTHPGDTHRSSDLEPQHCQGNLGGCNRELRLKRENIKYLILALTNRCNLRCCYCYRGATCDGLDMSDAVMDAALALGDNGNMTFIQITGGEPTLVPEKIVRLAEKSREMQYVPELAVQTNGTLLTESLMELFSLYKMQVGVSLDGPPELQERLRGKADETLRGLQLLEQAGVDFRITAVVSDANVLHLDKLVLVLAGFSNCRGIGLDLLVNRGRGAQSAVMPANPQLLDEGLRHMVLTLRAINRKRRTPIQLREMELLGQKRAGGRFCRAASGSSLAVDPVGRLAPCGQAMGDGAFSLGTIFKPESGSASLTDISLKSEECGNCVLAHCCPGDCPSRIHYNSGDAPPLACVMYRCLYGLRQGHNPWN